MELRSNEEVVLIFSLGVLCSVTLDLSLGVQELTHEVLAS